MKIQPNEQDRFGNIVKTRYNPDDVDIQICVLCCGVITDHGHSPYPLSSHGRCCINCNSKVVKARFDANWGQGR